MTNDVSKLLRHIPSLRHAPHSTLIAIVAVAAVLVFVMLMLIIYFISDFMRVEKTEHVAPDSHRLIMDLQKTLVSEMRGTAKQNTLMINLTIIFILITVIGMIVSIAGPSATMAFTRKMISQIMSLVPKAVKPAKEMIGH